MTLKKSALPAALAALLLITIGTGQAAAQNALTVESTPIDFGDVQVGVLITKQITITNKSNFDILINDVNIVDLNGVFSYDNYDNPLIPFTLVSWNSEDLVVSFQPSSTGWFEGNLNLSYSYTIGIPGMNTTTTEILSIPLVGYGEFQFDLVQAIDNLVVFTAAALVSGDLEGVSKGKSHRKGKKRGRGRHRRGKDRKAAHHERDFLKWILKAEKLILAGEFDKAHHLLSGVLRKVDGAPRPPDTVVGTAAGGVADQIRVILAALAG